MLTALPFTCLDVLDLLPDNLSVPDYVPLSCKVLLGRGAGMPRCPWGERLALEQVHNTRLPSGFRAWPGGWSLRPEIFGSGRRSWDRVVPDTLDLLSQVTHPTPEGKAWLAHPWGGGLRWQQCPQELLRVRGRPTVCAMPGAELKPDGGPGSCRDSLEGGFLPRATQRWPRG